MVLRPLPPAEEQKHPFSNAVYRMRECLSNLSAIQSHLQREMNKKGLGEEM